MSALSRALAALEEGRDDDAYAALVEAWRERRAPSLAELAELVDARSPSPSRPKPDALDVDDPRVSAFVLGALAEPPPGWSAMRRRLRALVAAARRLRDPRLAARAPAIARVWDRALPIQARAELGAELADAVAEIARVPVRAATDEEARLEAAIAEKLEPIAARRRTEAQLFADVYASPSDDGPRLVLADFLLEHGDPRGELVALQLARRDGRLDAEGAAREEELLEAHGRTWAGSLAPLLKWGVGSKTRFERGFLAVADSILTAFDNADVRLDEPSWATIERLQGYWPRALLYGAPLRGLRRLDLLHDEIVGLAARGVVFPNAVELSTNEPLAAPEALLAVLPALRTLEIMFVRGPLVEDVAALARLPLTRVEVSRWIEDDERTSAMPFDALVAGVRALPATVPEIALEPPWKTQPRPALVELRVVDGRYAVV